MWNVDTRKFEMFYDEELMTASNLDECRRRVENYGNLRGRPIGLDRIYNITWLDTLKHGSFSESFHKKR